ncbi:transcription regulator [Companilactobacillus tucceti DSM 20183]|uniref:Transcription regulator n=1 Tax=Companilactobacillus tucceti DSM 20183 TaxID=1423811 RepID=A0A0R1J1E8_9LACO|nr:TetR/AcrR family transcriptional regulator [Companilactobacillus tucceti]KRK65326.1 transcription regulator [Companilactobacillus tucceti DSM 20183]
MAATKHAQSIKQDSKDYLTTALLQILETKNLNEITISQVVKKAGVSRMAFYRNFETIGDLLTAYFEPLISDRFKDIKDDISEQDKLSKVGKFFVDYADTFKLSTDHGFEFVIKDIFDKEMMSFYETISLPKEITNTRRKYWVKFMSAGVYAIWREWLINGEKESLKEIHDILADFQNSTMKSLIR